MRALTGLSGLSALTKGIFVPDPNGLMVSVAGSGSGSGANWNNTLSYASLTWQRGKNYYIADGAYTSRDLDVAESGSTMTRLIKATPNSMGTNVGWNPTFGDGQASFSEGMVIAQGYWGINGVKGGGPNGGAFDNNDFGFLIPPSDTNNGAIVASLSGASPINGLDIRHCDFQGPSGGGSDNGKPVIFYTQNCNNSYFGYNRMRDTGSNMFRSWGTGCLIEKNYFGFFLSTAGNHGECMSVFGGTGVGNWEVRHNLITFTDGTGGFIFADDGGPGGYLVHGNIFAPVDGGSLAGGNGLFGTVSGRDLTGIGFYHNTIIGSTCPVMGILDGVSISGNVQNNLLYNLSNYGDMGIAALTCANNHFASAGAGTGTGITTSTGDPFVNWASKNFRLLADRTGSLVPIDAVNTDMLGNARTTGTKGALQFT